MLACLVDLGVMYKGTYRMRVYTYTRTFIEICKGIWGFTEFRVKKSLGGAGRQGNYYWL